MPQAESSAKTPGIQVEKEMMGVGVPKYLRVRDAILADIRAGRLKPGDKLPTREELMKLQRVSRSTVETALRELVRSGTLSTSKRGGTVVTQKTPALRVAVVSNIGEEELKAGRGEPHGVLALSRILTSSSENRKLTFLKADSITGGIARLAEYDAVVWLQPDEFDMAKLERFGAKAVVVNRYPKANSFVSTNHRAAMRDAARQVFSQCGGDFKVFYLEVERRGRDFVRDERRAGFVDACESLGRFYKLLELPFKYDAALKTLVDLPLDSNGKNVFISGTCVFSGALFRMAESKGMRFNENFFYADFDNEHSLARTGRQITTVVQDYCEMGDAVLRALDTIAAGGKAEIFVPHTLEMEACFSA